MNVVINKCFGGFSISKECAEYMEKLGSKQAKAELDEWRKNKKLVDYFLKHGKFPKGTKGNTSFLEIDAKYHKDPTFHGAEYNRTDKLLIKAVEELGDKANGSCAKLKVVEIPDGVEYTIEEYDGLEHIAENHRTW